MVQGCIPIQCPTSGFYIITVVFVQQMLSVSYSQSYFTYILTRLPVIFAPRNGSQCEKARWDVGRTKQSEVDILISQSCRACITMCASLTPDSYKQISIQFSKRHLCTLSVYTIRRLPTLESTSSFRKSTKTHVIVWAGGVLCFCCFRYCSADGAQQTMFTCQVIRRKVPVQPATNAPSFTNIF